jgi:hypothetical protein
MSAGGASAEAEAPDDSHRRRGNLELRCDEVHPCRCDAVFRASTPGEVVRQAREHGELVHFFTPVFYRPRRIAGMMRAAKGV